MESTPRLDRLGPASRAPFEWNGQSPASVQILKLLEEATRTDPSNLDPIFEVIDPDALDSIFQPSANDEARETGNVQFPMGDYWITVRADGVVEFRRID